MFKFNVWKKIGQDKSKQFLKTKTLLVPPAGEKSLAKAPPSWFQTSAILLPRARCRWLMAGNPQESRKWMVSSGKKTHQKHQPIKKIHQTWGYDYPIIAQTFAIYALSFSDDLIWLDGNVWLLQSVTGSAGHPKGHTSNTPTTEFGAASESANRGTWEDFL